MNWNQFFALIRLRLQISRNQNIRAGFVNVVLSRIVTIGFVIASVSAFLLSLIGGAFWSRTASTTSVYAAWTALIVVFLLVWLLDLLNKVQQSERISIEKLLHLPITMKGAFFLNYTSSFWNMIFMAFAPTMIGLSVGMTIGRGMKISISIVMVVAFLFFVTALTYLVRGWLGAVMKNRRTRGIILTGVPFLFVVVMLASKWMDFSFVNSVPTQTAFLPIAGWIPLDIIRADGGNWLSGIVGTALLTGFGFASLFFAYNSSLRVHTGAESKRSRRIRSKKKTTWAKNLPFKTFPFTSEPASAVAYFSLKSMMRAPESLMAILPLLALVVCGSPYLLGFNGFEIPEYIESSIPIGIMFMTMIGFPAFLFSSFSYDRDGFRSYILSPVQRRDILFGKNLAVAIPTLTSGWCLIVLVQIFLPLDLLSFLSTLIQVAATYLLICILGNAISIRFPIGLKRGSMQPVNAPVIPTIVVYLGILVGPALLLTPMSFASGIPMLISFATGTTTGWLYLLLSFVQLLLTWFCYLWTLETMGSWFWKREPTILDIVANIPE